MTDNNPVADVIDRAVRYGWCVRIDCSACASHNIRHALRAAVVSPENQPFDHFAAWSVAKLLSRVPTPETDELDRHEPVVRWIIHEIAPHVSDLDDALGDGFASNIRSRMLEQGS